MSTTIIYVTIDFQQQEGDIVLHSFGYAAKLSVADETNYTQWLITDENRLEAFAILEKDHLDHLCQSTIYSQYTADKQAQDEKLANHFSTKLKAAGLSDLDKQRLIAADKISNGDNFDTVISAAVKAFDDKILAKLKGSSKAKRLAYANQMFGKLVKVSLRTEWIENCTHALKTETDLPDYPIV